MLGAITTNRSRFVTTNEIQAGVIFEDSFEGSNNWTTNPNNTDTASTGIWQIGSPEETTSNGQTIQVGSGRTGTRALVTGLSAGSSVGTNDVDGGETTVLSPEIALPENANLALSLRTTFSHLDNATSEDHFHVYVISNGTQELLFDVHAESAVQPAVWTDFEFRSFQLWRTDHSTDVRGIR